VVIPTKKAERFACCISRASRRTNNQFIRATRLASLGEPQKTKFAFSFFKKIGGGRKKDKNAKAILIFAGSL
jgi:hypothetical protein